jgi:hypothetical protein
MSLIIPVPRGATYHDIQVTLEGENYTLEFRWNERIAAWFITVLDAEAENILLGSVRVVCSWPLWAYRAERLPRGLFFAVDTAGNNEDPGLNDFGDRVQLLYKTAAELGLEE